MNELTVDECVDYARRVLKRQPSRPTVLNWIKQGILDTDGERFYLKAKWVGRVWMVRRVDLDYFLRHLPGSKRGVRVGVGGRVSCSG